MKKKIAKKIGLKKLMIAPLHQTQQALVAGASGQGCQNPVSIQCTVFPAC